ncbi:MAG: hypothetical protein WCG47_12865 [Dermatophilaceae bacterium]
MPTSSGARIVFADNERTPRRRRVTTGVILALLVALGYAGWTLVRGMVTDLAPPTCLAATDGRSVSLAPEQAANAATIAAVSVKRGMPPRAATIAIATAMQESKLRNLTVGDRDSVGLFQQRPSQGWGTTEQILDPVYATNAFYDRLAKVDDYTTRSVTEVAQQVQRSGHPLAYAQHEDEARVLASVLTGQSPAGLACTLSKPDKPGDPAAVSAALERQLGVAATRTGDSVTVSATDAGAWAAAAWAVAHAEGRGVDTVRVGDRVWTRSDGAQWGQAALVGDVRLTLVST